uniref:Uncharacterized protein n=1 Tax=Medicago truncatula TaxID=3880 RepID=A2Q5R7_MEDTR|nr:hypothetical protein MtrDRAFT_AC168204g19v2 [Medicago truncatula]
MPYYPNNVVTFKLGSKEKDVIRCISIKGYTIAKRETTYEKHQKEQEKPRRLW